MQPFRQHTGLVAPLERANVDTDQIIPKQFLKRIERTGFGEFLFYDWRYLPDGQLDPSFVLNQPQYQGASILVADKNFGCGSSREHAPWALGEFGFRVIIAPSPITLPDEQARELMRRRKLTVDLETQTIADEDGLSVSFVINEFQRYCLLEGLDDIGLTLRHEDAISAYEASR
jgi:3-isopropylmalate/(R)-2-methylmalate dehydratase small subunit